MKNDRLAASTYLISMKNSKYPIVYCKVKGDLDPYHGTGIRRSSKADF